MNSIKMVTVAVLLMSFAAAQPAPLMAQSKGDKWDRRDRYEERWERQREREARREREERREERREARREARYEARRDYWDAARYYRNESRYRPYRMGRNDRIYRGSDDQYYCRRDDGTTGLIVGAIGGGILGTIIAPGESKVLGTIIGAGAGALIGRAIDDGDIVCR